MTQHRNLPVPLDFPEQPMLIEHILNGDVIPQRPRDGYINATLLCQKSGKAFSDYSRLARTQAFLDELVSIWEFPYRQAASLPHLCRRTAPVPHSQHRIVPGFLP